MYGMLQIWDLGNLISFLPVILFYYLVIAFFVMGVDLRFRQVPFKFLAFFLHFMFMNYQVIFFVLVYRVN